MSIGDRNMKVRIGFVTNSSSSNFIVACDSPLTKEKLLALFMVPAESPFYEMACVMANSLIETSERVDETYVGRYSGDEFIDKIAVYYLQHPIMNFVYYLSANYPYQQVMDGILPFFKTSHIHLTGEDAWYENDKPLPSDEC